MWGVLYYFLFMMSVIGGKFIQYSVKSLKNAREYDTGFLISERLIAQMVRANTNITYYLNQSIHSFIYSLQLLAYLFIRI